MLLFYLDTPRLHQEISSYNDLNQQNGILGEGIDPHLHDVCIQVRYRHRFFNQVGHESMYVSKAELVQVNHTPIICLRNFINKKEINGKN